MSEIEPREAWINFFLKSAHEVDSTFKRGAPKMKYVPIQTWNGRRNAISIWQRPTEVEISFTIDRNTDFEERLISMGLPVHYEEDVRHLITAARVSPDSLEGVLLREIAGAALRQALPKTLARRRRVKDRVTNAGVRGFVN